MTASAPDVERLPLLEAAVFLGCSVSTVRNLAHRGKLGAVRRLGKLLVSKADLEKLAAGEPVPVAAKPTPPPVRATAPAAPPAPRPALRPPLPPANRPPGRNRSSERTEKRLREMSGSVRSRCCQKLSSAGANRPV